MDNTKEISVNTTKKGCYYNWCSYLFQ